MYTDSGPEGTQATVAQLYHHPEKGETRGPVHHSAIVDGLVVRGEQLIIPLALQGEVMQLAHEGQQGQDKTLQWMRQSVWFPNMGAKVREFVESCLPCQAAQA